MPVTVRDLVLHRPLSIRMLAGDDGVELGWSNSSDLDDPSPFLEAGQLLLTTGRQFLAFEGLRDYEAYVQRVAAAGVVALGFGTEVLRAGTPAELIEACESAGVALVEVPYATPFIAVSRFVADRIAAEQRRLLEWALAAQESISRAVLGSGGLAAAVDSASRALGCPVAVLDPDGAVLEGAAPGWLRERAVALLRRGTRARDHGDDDRGSWSVQTLGHSGRLLGAVVAVRSDPLTPAELSVITLLTALTELALEHAEDQRLGFRSVAQQLLALLRDGRVDAVRRSLEHLPAQLPAEPFRILALAAGEVAPTLRDSLERMAAGRGRRLFVVEHDAQLLLFVDGTSRVAVEARLAESEARAGLSSEARWRTLDEALTQAVAALAGAAPGRILAFDELMAGTVLGLLTESRVAELARLRLGGQLATPDGTARLGEAAVWLAHNAVWDAAARELGLHRHTLKQRMAELGRELDLQLDTFRGRAELWAMLVALDLARSSLR
ncbi:PucR family transcriptional regulator ligand-binding domain-containing protein [Herbiconiux sp. KACC 21604]|uniref:PucR family transcriptional regulator n=1 Tax=unclassified Herbiconiux TaxID=2618217 RepID=UPI001490CDD4|nr:PucR family transcriptional regulator [Herbiconiux sp. SALV-R1]QJU54811.1 PucR family transcriptional regulator [Herbiconiux sp. SALV-R1]WPO85927.1 PucR family transcriptional regulator ligand-binding domain-containing protein [Herbiconiux sp. KACC 21604]